MPVGGPVPPAAMVGARAAGGGDRGGGSSPFTTNQAGGGSSLERPAEGRAKAKQKRNFGEITSDKDFQERCVAYKKGCAIGILPAM